MLRRRTRASASARRSLSATEKGARSTRRDLRRWIALVVALGGMVSGIGLVLVTAALGQPPSATVVGDNLPVNVGAIDESDFSAHNSPTLVRNPVNTDNLVIVNRIDIPRYSCALHISFDAGARWSETPMPPPEDDEELKCYAPDVAFAADGTLYLIFVTLEGPGNVPGAVWLTSSEDGGRTLAPPTRVLDELAFQVRLRTNPADDDGALYLTWLQADEVGLYRFTNTGNPIMFMRSDDEGLTWGEPVEVSGDGRERAVAPSPVVGRNGDIYVAFLDLGEDRLDYEGAHEGLGGPAYPGPWQLVVARSSDGGLTWTESIAEDNLVAIDRFVVFIPPAPSIAVDGERVYVAFHDATLEDADVRLWTSGDGGVNWDEPVRVNDTELRDGTAQYLPALTVAPSGRVDIVYYDRRGDSNNLMNEVSLQSSSDGGRSFGDSVRLSDRAFDSRIGFGNERGLGDLGSRLALVATDDRTLAVWTDTRAGTSATRKQDLVRAVVDVSEGHRLPAWVAASLAATGVALVLAALTVLVAPKRLPLGRRHSGSELKALDPEPNEAENARR